MIKIVLWTLGIILVLLGIAGLVLPVLPGWALIFFGVSLIMPRLALKARKHVTRKFFKKSIVFLEEWKNLPVIAGFTTRHFPLILRSTDELQHTHQRQKFHALIYGLFREQTPSYQLTGHFAYLNQVHGDHVACLDNLREFHERRYYHLMATDVVITNIADLILLVMTADCLSVFFYAGKTIGRHRAGKGFLWAGIAHAGWRGTYQEIAKKTARLLCEKSGCTPKEVQVVFGPCIGPKAYEVGEEFCRFFPSGHPSHQSLKNRKNKWYFDLIAENRRQLIEAGIPGDQIQDQGICSYADKADFYSYRREKSHAGRMISFICLK